MAFCRVAREAPTTAHPIVGAIYQSFDLANTTINEMHKVFLNLTGVENDEQLWAKTKSHINTFENTIRANIASLNEEVSFSILGKWGFCDVTNS